MSSKKKINLTVGIDLGTTTTLVSCFDKITKQSTIIDANGLDYIPSVVSYEIINGKAVATKVGIEAMNNAPANPKNTIFNSKRFFALTAEDVHQTAPAGQASRILTYKSLEETASKSYKPVVKDGKIMIELEENGTKVFITPVDVAIAILQTCKKNILRHFNIDNDADVAVNVAITVPAYFNNHQREEVKNAGEIAGFNVMRIVNEPTAAALARAEQLTGIKNLLVVDLGGGTFDVSLLHTDKDGDATTMEVKCTEGHLALGGSDFDNAIGNWIISEMDIMQLRDTNGILLNVKNNRESMARLAELAEKAKKVLSNADQAIINLSLIDHKISTTKTLTLTKNKFNELIADRLKEIKQITQYVLDQCKTKYSIDKADITMLLTGGSTRVPAVYELFKSFGIKLLAGNRPDSDVVTGAGKLASSLVEGGSDILLIDVTPLGLGIETLGGITTRIIEKNTSIPTKATQTFSTAEDNQTSVSIHVVQGERSQAKDNRSLGRFDLNDIPPAPRGVPIIEVTFEVDANGIVNVTAREKNTGKEAKITIQGKVSDSDKKAMEDAAAANLAYDEKVLKNSQLRNTSENKIYEGRKVMKEHEAKLDEAIKTEITNAINELEEALRKSTDIVEMDFDTINAKSDALSSSMMKIYEKMNAQAQQPGAEAKAESETEQPQA